MKPEKAAELAAVLKHWSEGGTIQRRTLELQPVDFNVEWNDCFPEIEGFDFKNFEYRIKQIPRKFYYVYDQNNPELIGALCFTKEEAESIKEIWGGQKVNGYFRRYSVVELEEVIK